MYTYSAQFESINMFIECTSDNNGRLQFGFNENGCIHGFDLEKREFIVSEGLRIWYECLKWNIKSFSENEYVNSVKPRFISELKMEKSIWIIPFDLQPLEIHYR